MRNRIIIVFIGVCFILSIFASLTCKDEVAGVDVTSIVFPDKNVSYHKHVEPIFLHLCAIPGGCHAGDEPAPPYRPLNLETYEDFRNRWDLLDFVNPANSYLVRALKGTMPNVEQMPINRTKLNENQINGFITWIKEGARGDN